MVDYVSVPRAGNATGRISVLRATMLAVLFTVFFAPAQAQPPAPPCVNCRITMVPVTTIAAGGVDHRFLANAQLARDHRGLYYASQAEAGAAIHVFDASGHYVRSVGKGPDERPVFRRVYRHTSGPGDSLAVVDMDRRVHVFAPGGSHVRSVRLPVLPHALFMLGDGRFVAQGELSTREAAGYPLHILAADGTVVRSFGSQQAMLRPDDFTSTLRQVALAPDGTILAAWPNRYLVERWDTTGKRLDVLSRDVDWFEPWAGRRGDMRLMKPHPYQGIPSLAGGVLWTLVGVPARDWRPQSVQGEGETMVPITRPEQDRATDLMIEALDRRTGALIAALRIETGTYWFLGDGLIYRRVVGGDERIAFEVLRLVLTPTQ